MPQTQRPKSASESASPSPPPPSKRSAKWEGDARRIPKLIHDAACALQLGVVAGDAPDEIQALRLFLTHTHAACESAMVLLHKLDAMR